MGIRTQNELADLLGIDQSRVSRWERGKHFPDPEFRDRLKEKLNVDDSFFDVSEQVDQGKTVGNMTPQELARELKLITQNNPLRAQLHLLIDDLSNDQVEIFLGLIEDRLGLKKNKRSSV